MWVTLLWSVWLAFCAIPQVRGAAWYVDDSVSSSGNGESWDAAFKTIQEGIDAASDGDTVIVAEGTYIENIKFNGKNIVLTSADPLNPTVVDHTVIDGNHAGSVITFVGTENETCVLSGFAIRDGNSLSGGGICGGTPLRHTGATIENNDVAVNEANCGGGVAYCDGQIKNNVLIGNSAAAEGGGFYDCDALIQNNALSWNSAVCGGGLYGCDGTLTDNELLYNSALDGGGLARCHGLIGGNSVAYCHADYAGGGLYRCDGTIEENSIGRNVALDGGGLAYCDGTIQKNTIRANGAEYGGALYRCNGLIQDNLIGRGLDIPGDEPPYDQIYANKADHGGGLSECEGIIQRNIVNGNNAKYGGGFHNCDGIIQDNLVSENHADSHGGGLYGCDAMIRNNRITGNLAGERGDGGGLYRCDGTIRNNLVAANRGDLGGGLAFCRGTIENNTVVSNEAFRGGGLHGCYGIIQNSIIWGNVADGGPQLWDSAEPDWSCIQDWIEGGERNTAEDPRFRDADGPDDSPSTFEDNNYRLSAGSPCIDAGKNEAWMTSALDLDGNPRIAFGVSSPTVDMGAYEYNPFQFKITQVSKVAAGQAELTWTSRPGDTYTVWSCTDLTAPTWAEEAMLTSQGTSTSWTDPSSAAPYKFYRIQSK